MKYKAIRNRSLADTCLPAPLIKPVPLSSTLLFCGAIPTGTPHSTTAGNVALLVSAYTQLPGFKHYGEDLVLLRITNTCKFSTIRIHPSAFFPLGVFASTANTKPEQTPGKAWHPYAE